MPRGGNQKNCGDTFLTIEIKLCKYKRISAFILSC